ncbi:hypothetical protein QQ045_016616 [Rhodiola kirilowii]
MEAQCNKPCGKSNVVKETSVGTVDYQSSAGQRTEEIYVHVIHQQHDEQQATSGQILANATAAVTSTLQSAKEALSDPQQVSSGQQLAGHNSTNKCGIQSLSEYI